jgi:tetratricopeptide (TPR) repeat protein
LEAIDQLTNLYLRMDQLPYAEEILEKGLRLDAENIRLLHHSARLNYKKKAYPLVVEALERTMAIGDSTSYYQMLAGVSYLHLDSIENAFFHLNDLIENGEETEHTHHYLGLCYREMENLEKSIYHLEKAVALGLSPKMEIYHADLGTMEAENGQYRSAINHFQKAYDYSGDPEHLFHLARNCDIYYKDKSIALRHYNKYLKTKDTKYRKYTEDRIMELKENLHFQKQ